MGMHPKLKLSAQCTILKEEKERLERVNEMLRKERDKLRKENRELKNKISDCYDSIPCPACPLEDLLGGE